MIKNDRWIRETALKTKMIEPFEPGLVREGKISYGVSSFGYDFRLSERFSIPRPLEPGRTLDPKEVRPEDFEEHRSQQFLVPAHGYVIAASLEYFRIPRNILGICTGKSTYARSGLLVNITPLEPEWEGRLTFTLFNPTPHPIKVYAGEGIAQILFLEGSAPETSYADRKGKYQGQEGLTPSKV